MAVSVWQCYTDTAKGNIIEFLNATPQGRALKRDDAHLNALDDDALYSLLQQELGLSYLLEVEAALKGIPFKGDVLELTDWISFHSEWLKVLKRSSAAATPSDRRLAELFRNAIPDVYVKEWLSGLKHPTWLLAYDAMLTALDDPKWHTAYTKDVRTRRPAAPAAPAAHEKHGGKKDAPPAQQAAPQPSSAQPAAEDDQHTQKKGNVNPNFNPQLNDNPSNAPCSRCQYIHKWLPPLCTAVKNKAQEVITPGLTAEEVTARLTARYEKGFFFKTVPKTVKQSPSPQAAAAASRQTAATLSGNSGSNGNGGGK
jgi:hypothetical protein